MLITTKDEAGRPVRANIDDARVAAWDHYFTMHPEVFGFGVGDRYGRSGARDAVEAQAFAVSQLAYVESNTYARWYTPTMFERLLPNVISYAAGEGAQSVEYQIVDYVGMGKRMSPASNDVPFVDVAYVRKAIPVAQGGVGYFYSQEDLRVSSFLKRPLPQEKLKAAMIAYRNHINLVALQGEAGSNFKGLFNFTGVTTANRPSGAVWDAATADTIISDIIAGMSAVGVATKGNSWPTKIAMPISSFALLQKARASVTNQTVMEYLMTIYPGLEVIPVDELSALGAGATKRVVFYNPTDDNIVFHIPMAVRFLPPQPEVLRVAVYGEYKYAGLEVRRIISMYYMDAV